MQKIVTSERLPIKLWLNDVEHGAMEQAKNLANLIFAFKHIAIMPDCHQGYGMPIGGVLATQKVIIPNAVGVDIGCGMCAMKTNIIADSVRKDTLKDIMQGIRSIIPLGFNHQKERQDEELMPQGYAIDKMKIVKQQYIAALKQLGTLGGGNHFIEIQKSNEGILWIMIHSGSRNFGLKVAEYYNTLAKTINTKRFSVNLVDPKADLAYLPDDIPEAYEYFQEMKYCTDFALANRKLMMKRIQEILIQYLPEVKFESLSYKDQNQREVMAPTMINIAHNYAANETHFNTEVILHRKGATSAKKGEIGIIPGSQGTKSYIVEGLGNEESFMSCSHGAGRVMSRKAAQKNLNLHEEVKKLDDLGIIHSIRTANDLDEAASCYKDISQVMDLQSDLVRILVELTPLAVVKG